MPSGGIFVSHSQEDSLFCHALVVALRAAGADVWYDEHNLDAGELLRTIQVELRLRPIFVVVLSKAAFRSRWVRDECTWAYNLQRREPARIILPVTAGPITPHDFDELLFLESYKRIEAPHYQPPSELEAITGVLKALSLDLVSQHQAGNMFGATTGESTEELVNRGEALCVLEQWEDALPLLQRAVRLDPRSLDAWIQLARILSELRRDKEALDVYDNAIVAHPNVAMLWSNKAVILGILGRYEESLAAAECALSLDPGFDRALNEKGLVLLDMERYQEALTVLERAVAIDPTFYSSWANLGAALFHLGRDEEALRALDRTLELNANNASAWEYKGRALSRMQRYTDAIAALKPALALDPNSAVAWTTKGLALIYLGHPQDALAAIDRAIALNASQCIAYAWLCRAYALQSLGRIPESRIAAAKARELNSEI